MALTVTCQSCGREYQPTTKDLILGVWKVCPACRPAPPRHPLHSPAQGGRPAKPGVPA